MNAIDFQQLWPVLAIGGFFGWRVWKARQVKAGLPELLRKGAVIVDVRSAAEFQGGANANSINIPLDQLEAKADSLDRSRPVVLCCASGARSGIGVGILKRRGFSEVHNAGSWTNTVILSP